MTFAHTTAHPYSLALLFHLHSCTRLSPLLHKKPNMSVPTSIYSTPQTTSPTSPDVTLHLLFNKDKFVFTALSFDQFTMFFGNFSAICYRLSRRRSIGYNEISVWCTLWSGGYTHCNTRAQGKTSCPSFPTSRYCLMCGKTNTLQQSNEM